MYWKARGSDWFTRRKDCSHLHTHTHTHTHTHAHTPGRCSGRFSGLCSLLSKAGFESFQAHWFQLHDGIAVMDVWEVDFWTSLHMPFSQSRSCMRAGSTNESHIPFLLGTRSGLLQILSPRFVEQLLVAIIVRVACVDWDGS